MKSALFVYGGWEGHEPGAEVVASGILRLKPVGFARQLATFRAAGPSPAGQVAAIGRFDALFLGQRWQVYGRPLVRGLRKRGG